MSNQFYNPSGNPGTGSQGLSALMRGEFIAISAAFNLLPAFTSTGSFATVFNQQGNFTFTLPAEAGTLTLATDVATAVATAVATETTRAEAAEATITTAVSTETTRAEAAEATITTAVGTETARAEAAEATITTAVSAETTRAEAAEAANSTASNHNAGRNRLHNGGFRINQRGYVTSTALSSGVYAHDRWKAGASGCTYAFTQTQPTTGIIITAGSLQQIVESVDVEGGSYVLSWVGTATGRINSGSYAASPVTVTGLASNTAITVEFQSGSVGMVQFEVGAVASAFERRQMQVELSLCQRFYQVGNLTVEGYAPATGYFIGSQQSFLVQMRVAPTMTGTYTTQNACAGSVGSISSGGFLSNALSNSAGNVQALGTYVASADL